MHLLKSKQELSCLALACPWVWYVFFYRILQDPQAIEIAFYVFRGLVAIAIAIAFLFLHKPRPVLWRNSSIAVASLACVSPGVAYLGLLLGSDLAVYTAILFISAGRIWNFVMCIRLYSKFEVKTALKYVLLSIIFALLVRIPLELLPPEIGILAVVPLPLLCVWMCFYAEKHCVSDSSDRIRQRMKPTRQMVRTCGYIAVSILVYGLLIGFLRGENVAEQIGDVEFPTIAHIMIRLVLALLLLWLLVVRKKIVNLNQLFQFALMLSVSTIVGGSLFPGNPTFLALLSLITQNSIELIFLLVLTTLACRNIANPCTVFGFGWGLYMMAVAGGLILHMMIGVNTAVTVSLCLFYLVIFVTVLISGALRTDREALLAIKDTHELGTGALLPLEESCERVTEEFGLTAREQEILPYLYKGVSKHIIAKTLSISENTVRTHSKHIYEKLGIHSRQELIILMESLQAISGNP